MARQRFIYPEIWTDEVFSTLEPLERLLFIGLFSIADDAGRLPANPIFLRNAIFPCDELSPEQVRQMRDTLVRRFRHLVLYQVDGTEYLAFTNWRQYQNPRYVKPSRIPPPPADGAEQTCGESAQSLHRTCTESAESLHETRPDSAQNLSSRVGDVVGDVVGVVDVDVVGVREGEQPARDGSDNNARRNSAKDEPDPPASQPTCQPEATAQEREILNVLRSIPGYPFDYARDLEHIRTLSVDFPAIDLLVEARKWRTYKLDKPLKPKSNARLQFRNWCEIAEKRWVENRGGKDGGARRRDPAAAARDYRGGKYGRIFDDPDDAGDDPGPGGARDPPL